MNRTTGVAPPLNLFLDVKSDKHKKTFEMQDYEDIDKYKHFLSRINVCKSHSSAIIDDL